MISTIAIDINTCERCRVILRRDFTTDTLADGRNFRTLNILDDFTLECVAKSIARLRGTRVLDRLHAAVGLQQTIVVDNGPESAGRTLDAWAYARDVTLRVIRPGKPIENAYVQSFNGKFRDECLNDYWFVSLPLGTPHHFPRPNSPRSV